MQENESCLCFFAENTLIKGIKVAREINGKSDDKEEQKMIIDFINRLPERLKELPNRDELIIRVLEKQGINTMWTEKKKQEQEFEKKIAQNESQHKNRTINKDDNELEGK